MGRCKTAEKLLKIIEKEVEKANLTGYDNDLDSAIDNYVNHIQDHGCWRGDKW